MSLLAGTVEFRLEDFGPFFARDLDAAAKVLGMCRRHLGGHLKKNRLPTRLAGKVKDMGDLLAFPLDPPLPATLIGTVGFQIHSLLQADKCSLAIAVGGNALQPGAKDSDTLEPLNLSTLHRSYIETMYSAAIARNKKSRKSQDGLPAFRQIRRAMEKHLSSMNVDERDSEWEAWSYLKALTLGYELSYQVMNLGDGWFREHPLERGSDKQIAEAKEVLDMHGPKVFEEMLKLGDRHVSTLIAWNVLQIAALANCDTTFIRCLEILHDRCKKSWELLKVEMNKDLDTKPMMTRERVATFVARIDAQSKKTH